jgi:ArsR family transcriptional regulator
MTRQLAEMENLFKALADATRLRILGLLLTGEVCVCDIHESLKIPQPKASRHLAYLRRTGLVETRREGLWIHYRLGKLADPVLAAIVDAVRHALTHVDAVTARWKRLRNAPAAACRSGRGDWGRVLRAATGRHLAVILGQIERAWDEPRRRSVRERRVISPPHYHLACARVGRRAMPNLAAIRNKAPSIHSGRPLRRRSESPLWHSGSEVAGLNGRKAPASSSSVSASARFASPVTPSTSRIRRISR